MKLKELLKIIGSDNIVVYLYSGYIGFGRKIISYSGDGNILEEDIKERAVTELRHCDDGLIIILEEV